MSTGSLPEGWASRPTVEFIFKKLTQARKSKVFKAMSTLNLQVKLKGPEHLIVFTAILQTGVPQEVFETDAASALQVGCFQWVLCALHFDS